MRFVAVDVEPRQSSVLRFRPKLEMVAAFSIAMCWMRDIGGNMNVGYSSGLLWWILGDATQRRPDLEAKTPGEEALRTTGI